MSVDDSSSSQSLGVRFVWSAMATAAVACVIAAACTTAGSPEPVVGGRTSLVGRWGGQSAALTLTDSGGTIQYDCAHGGLLAALQPDEAGRFDVPGIHVREHGGPVSINERIDSLPARFTGVVRGDLMTLRVLVGVDTIGPLELRRGVDAMLTRCL